MTTKVIRSHRKWRDSIGRTWHFVLVVYNMLWRAAVQRIHKEIEPKDLEHEYNVNEHAEEVGDC